MLSRFIEAEQMNQDQDDKAGILLFSSHESLFYGGGGSHCAAYFIAILWPARMRVNYVRL